MFSRLNKFKRQGMELLLNTITVTNKHVQNAIQNAVQNAVQNSVQNATK
jgi:hypothetical protein